MEKALTYTIIAGNRDCTCDCGICISKMTPDYNMGSREPDVNRETFKKATTVALNHGAETALITGKGEPTLYPAQIAKYLHSLEESQRDLGRRFDRRELQTNGFPIARDGFYDQFLDVWKDLGLDTIAISVYHYDKLANARAFRPKEGGYFDLPDLLEKIHSRGMSTRLSCVMLNDYIDSVDGVEKLIDYARVHDVFQLTLRMADVPINPACRSTADYVRKHRLTDEKLRSISDFLEQKGTVCDILPHGATVYQVDGQNVCLTTGLTREPGEKRIRQLIFFPPDWLTTSWETVAGGRIL